MKGAIRMNISREQLHEMVDAVDTAEYDVVYHVLSKFIREDFPTQDEIDAIKVGREDFRLGHTVRHEDINWD